MRTFIVCTILIFSWNDVWIFIYDNPTVVSGLLGVLTGGSITLFITGRYYKKKRKDDVSFKLVDQYFEKFEQIEIVKGFLYLKEEYDNDQLNQIIKLGNWYNFANGLDIAKMTGDEILEKMPLGLEISEFKTTISNKAYLQENEIFKEAMKGWTFLFDNEGKGQAVDGE